VRERTWMFGPQQGVEFTYIIRLFPGIHHVIMTVST
jgi:hypothetical protein